MSRGDFGFHKEETRYEYDLQNSMPYLRNSDITSIISVDDFTFLLYGRNFNIIIKTYVGTNWNIFYSPKRSKWIKLQRAAFLTLKPQYWDSYENSCIFSCIYTFTDADGYDDTILIQFKIFNDGEHTYIDTYPTLISENEQLE